MILIDNHTYMCEVYVHKIQYITIKMQMYESNNKIQYRRKYR